MAYFVQKKPITKFAGQLSVDRNYPLGTEIDFLCILNSMAGGPYNIGRFERVQNLSGTAIWDNGGLSLNNGGYTDCTFGDISDFRLQGSRHEMTTLCQFTISSLTGGGIIFGLWHNSLTSRQLFLVYYDVNGALYVAQMGNNLSGQARKTANGVFSVDKKYTVAIRHNVTVQAGSFTVFINGEQVACNTVTSNGNPGSVFRAATAGEMTFGTYFNLTSASIRGVVYMGAVIGGGAPDIMLKSLSLDPYQLVKSNSLLITKSISKALFSNSQNIIIPVGGAL